MTDLGAWLLENNDRPRQAGVWDCCAFPAAWAVASGWPDPMMEWRGTYDSEDAGLALADGHGGLVTLFERGMRAAGIPSRDGLVAGDVGVLSIRGGEAGAIFTGQRWALIAERGIAYASVEPQCVAGVWAVARG